VKDRRLHYKPEAGYARLGGPSTFEDEVIREEVNGGAHHAFCAARLKGGTAEGIRFLVSCCHVAPNFVLKGKKERDASRLADKSGE
jgi:hypothetical protein